MHRGWQIHQGKWVARCIGVLGYRRDSAVAGVPGMHDHTVYCQATVTNQYTRKIGVHTLQGWVVLCEEGLCKSEDSMVTKQFVEGSVGNTKCTAKSMSVPVESSTWWSTPKTDFGKKNSKRRSHLRLVWGLRGIHGPYAFSLWVCKEVLALMPNTTADFPLPPQLWQIIAGILFTASKEQQGQMVNTMWALWRCTNDCAYCDMDGNKRGTYCFTTGTATKPARWASVHILMFYWRSLDWAMAGRDWLFILYTGATWGGTNQKE